MGLLRTYHLSVVLCLSAISLVQDVASSEMHELSPNATQVVAKILRRQKRYLAFPEGSSVSV